MSLSQIIQHIYLPLLTQETAVMISTFTYGLKNGVSSPVLIIVNTAAVITDLLLFFVPVHFLSQRLHDALVARFRERYDTGTRIVAHFGAFRTAAALGFVMPSIAAMIVVGLLRLPFRHALAGLFAGSAVYVALPLIIALPLASFLPRSVLPFLPWIPLGLAFLFVLVALIRFRTSRRRPATPEQAPHPGQ
jgi:hypothetical protein